MHSVPTDVEDTVFALHIFFLHFCVRNVATMSLSLVSCILFVPHGLVDCHRCMLSSGTFSAVSNFVHLLGLCCEGCVLRCCRFGIFKHFSSTLLVTILHSFMW